MGENVSNKKNEGKKSLSLGMQILIALILAIIVGLLMQNVADIAETYIKPFGSIFLNLVKFIVCPIVLFSIMSGIVSMKDVKKVGAIGGITVVYYFFTTAIAISLGLFVANLFKGTFPMLATSSIEFADPVTVAPMEVVVDLFPSNFLIPMTEENMLQIIIGAIIIGFAVILLEEKGEPAAFGINVINDVCMKAMEMILKLSPIGVFCLFAPVVASNGAMVIGSLAKVLLAAYISYVLHAVIVYSITVSAFAKIKPSKFFKEMMPAILFAFSSASSVGTIPINMECTEKLGASKEVSSFVLPLGATINMDGTAIYQGVCCIFIASCYGIDLNFSQMITIVITATLASVGTAGVPGAGMVMMAMVLTSVGLPVDGIALIAGVDRIFDMGRTTLNITGDASCAVIVSHLIDKKNAKKAAS